MRDDRLELHNRFDVADYSSLQSQMVEHYDSSVEAWQTQGVSYHNYPKFAKKFLRAE